MIESVTSTGTTSAPARELTAALPALGQAEPLGVAWVDVHRAAGLAAGEVGEVVHPGVVRPQIAAPDQDELVALARQRLREAAEVVEQRRRAELDLAAGGAQHLRQARLQRPEVDPVRVLLEHVERECGAVAAARLGRRSRRRRHRSEASDRGSGPGPRRSPSAATTSSGSIPCAGEPSVTVSRRAISSATMSSSASTSASGPAPATSPVIRSIVRHSGSIAGFGRQHARG